MHFVYIYCRAEAEEIDVKVIQNEDVEKTSLQSENDSSYYPVIKESYFNSELDDTSIEHSSDPIYMVLVGDSYAQGYNPDMQASSIADAWPAKTAALMNCTQYVSECYGGVGCRQENNGISFSSLLDSSSEDVADANLVKWVIICGGYNDLWCTYLDIRASVINTINKARCLYPNANIYIGMIGKNIKDENCQNRLINIITPAYKEAADTAGGIYIKESEILLEGVTDYFVSDGYHPSFVGQEVLAEHIAHFIISYESGIITEPDPGISFASGLQKKIIGITIIMEKLIVHSMGWPLILKTKNFIM